MSGTDCFSDASSHTPSSPVHLDQLRNQLRETGSIPGPSTTPAVRTPTVSSLLDASPELSPGVIVLPSVSLAATGPGSTTTPGSSPINNHAYPVNSSPSPPRDLLIAGWNPDLPSPTIVNHLIDVFFKCDPCGSRILHRPSFLAAMQLPAYHSKFPHVALLHAIVGDLVTTVMNGIANQFRSVPQRQGGLQTPQQQLRTACVGTNLPSSMPVKRDNTSTGRWPAERISFRSCKRASCCLGISIRKDDGSRSGYMLVFRHALPFHYG